MKRLALPVAVMLAVIGLAPARAAGWRVSDVVTAIGLAAVQESWTADVVDFNGDGRQDLWIGYHDQGGKLWRNDGDGTMTWVARSAWPIRALSPAGSRRLIDRHGCAWGDVDRNTLVDAYCTVGRTGFNWVKDAGVDNELWLQTAPGSFTDVGTELGVGDPYGRGRNAVLFDATGDGRLDLYVLNERPRPGDSAGQTYGQNKLFVNETSVEDPFGFRLVPAPGWGLDRHLGFGRTAIAFDQDGDSLNDLLVTGQRRLFLFRNTGSRFLDESNAIGLPDGHAQSVARTDVDSDGTLDLVVLRPYVLQWQPSVGAAYGPPRFIRSFDDGLEVAVGDADGDGREDVFVQRSAESSNPVDHLLLNRGSTWVSLRAPAVGGVGSDVDALRLRPHVTTIDFVVLNGGGGVRGPVQMLRLVTI